MGGLNRLVILETHWRSRTERLVGLMGRKHCSAERRAKLARKLKRSREEWARVQAKREAL